jgi:hypothetical protein
MPMSNKTPQQDTVQFGREIDYNSMYKLLNAHMTFFLGQRVKMWRQCKILTLRSPNLMSAVRTDLLRHKNTAEDLQ